MKTNCKWRKSESSIYAWETIEKEGSKKGRKESKKDRKVLKRVEKEASKKDFSFLGEVELFFIKGEKEV